MAGTGKCSARRGFVLDAALALLWCFPDAKERDAEKYLELLATGYAVVPANWFPQVADVLLNAERSRGLTESETSEALRLFGELPLEMDRESGVIVAREVVRLARKHAVTIEDAAYLELALRLHLPLATVDRGLVRAARAAGVKPLP